MKKLLLALLLVYSTDVYGKVFPVEKFDGGYFDRFSADAIPIGSSPNMSNVYTDEDPGVIKRHGFATDVNFGTSPVRNIYQYSKAGGETYKIVICSNTIYNNTQDNVILGDWSDGEQTDIVTWLDRAYFINPAEPLTYWDGTATAVDSDAPHGRIGVIYANRMFIAGMSGNRSTIQWSEINLLTDDNWAITNVDYVGQDDNDVIVAMVVYAGKLFILKNKSIWVLVGTDPLTWYIRNISREVGCVDKRSIQEFFGKLVFLSLRGIEEFDGVAMGDEVSWSIENLINTIRQVKGLRGFASFTTGPDWSRGTYFVGTDTFTVRGDLTVSHYIQKVDDYGDGTCVELDTSSNPHVCYADTSASDVFYSSYTPATGWAKHTVDASAAATLWNGDLALDSFNNPHMVYRSGDTIRYASHTATVGWNTYEIGDTEQLGGVPEMGIALSPTNIPHVVYNDFNIGVIYTSHTYGVGWSSATLGATPSTAHVDIKVDSSGNPHAFYAISGTSINYSSYTIGLGWSTHAVDSAGSTCGIDLDSNDAPHFVWETGDGMWYSTYTWANDYFSRIDVDTDGADGTDCSIAVDSDDNPHISYWDEVLTDLRYSSYTYSSETWALKTLDGEGSTGKWTHIAVNGNNEPHISYRDVDNDDIKYYSSLMFATYISTSVNVGPDWARWGYFEAEETYNGGNIDYYARYSETAAGIDAEKWQSINNGIILSGTTPYIQYKAVLYSSEKSSVPVLGSISTNWYDNYFFNPVDSEVYEKRYWLSVSTIGGTETSNMVIVMNRDKKFMPFRQIEAYTLSLFKNKLYHGSALDDGWIYQQDVDDLYTDNGNAIDAFYETKDMPFASLNEKHYLKYWITATNAGGDMTIEYALDGSTHTWSTATSVPTTSGRRMITYDVPFIQAVYGNYIRFRISNNDADETFNLRRIDCVYELFPLP